MTTKAIKKPRGLVQRAARFVAHNPVLKFIFELLRVTGRDIEESIYWLVLTGLIGAVFVPIMTLLVFNAPEFFGREFARWCIERGSCDFTTNIVSAAVALFVSFSVLVYFLLLWFWPEKTSQSIYYTVQSEITEAGDKGIQAEGIANITGLDIADVHAMIGYLFSDGAIEVVPGTKGTYRNTPE